MAASDIDATEALRSSPRAIVLTLNAYLMYLCRSDIEVARFAASANIVTCDSRILNGAARLFGQRLPIRTGADMVAELIGEEGAPPLVIIGPEEDLVRKIESPNQLIAIECPYLDSSEALWRLIKRELKIKLRENPLRHENVTYLIAIGPKKQEYVANKIISEMGASRIICCGASIDFLTKKEKRAPRFVQRNGFEWLWRLIQNPKRKWKVVLVYSLKGVFAFVHDILQEKPKKVSPG
ncbi:WecB/TagA/CpsF family glycosyltransferase [Novosphingobium album (ex Hu et al. 2023)]|uniref:WecB/TagA/CpsF family glycosyltransferase n=1 Tax=Novosphingobium album (ex Hu et al. 2023) TaxID=2930093 RepID=A0ABT0B5X1_9SPHN|nr:WecB/TagA/CpsF family glycosyltransferase [Novosphingobium album (ex Hu et al. 2023)]MCJ2180439.1 WecB/TagA/CpsF family glycosyltransferase [Novosphingobium album (ex Hu et al. 2023)]